MAGTLIRLSIDYNIPILVPSDYVKELYEQLIIPKVIAKYKYEKYPNIIVTNNVEEMRCADEYNYILIDGTPDMGCLDFVRYWRRKGICGFY